MTDFGEYTPYSSAASHFHSSIPAERYHNAYPHEWARLHDEVVRELGLEREAVMFHRSAFTLSPGRMNLMWAGDQNVTWDEHDGIKSAVSHVPSYAHKRRSIERGTREEKSARLGLISLEPEYFLKIK